MLSVLLRLSGWEGKCHRLETSVRVRYSRLCLIIMQVDVVSGLDDL